jgi:type II protein arginine methyltransferase
MEKVEILLQGNHLNTLSQVAVAKSQTLNPLGSENSRIADLAARLVVLGESHMEKKQFADALDCFESALYLNPENRQAQLGRNQAYCTMIPRWHFEMLNDEERNAAFEKALSRVILDDTIVLDIGSGTGLLAMMAARAGAGETYSCEMVAPLAELARETIGRNGLADKILILNKKSTDLSVGIDMARKANLLVTETVDCGLLGEGIIPSIKHAKENLLTHDAQIIPMSASVLAMVVESPRLRHLNHVNTAAGFDVSLIRQYASARYFPVRLSAFNYIPLTEPFEAFHFDFVKGTLLPARETIHVPVARDGTCQTIIFWFNMQLDSETSISNEPYSSTHWEQAIQCLEEEVQVKAGQTLLVESEHDCCSLSFKLNGIA